MPEYTVPEIQRTSLTSVILTLKCLGVHDVIRCCLLLFPISLNEACNCLSSRLLELPCHDVCRFPYLDHPEERFILDALKKLYQFDAIDRLVFIFRLFFF